MIYWILGFLGVFFAIIGVLWRIFLNQERDRAQKLGFDLALISDLDLGFEFRPDLIVRAYSDGKRILYRTDLRHLLGMRRFSDDMLRSWVVSFRSSEDFPRTVLSRSSLDGSEKLPLLTRQVLEQIPDGVDFIVLDGSRVHVSFGTRLRTLDQVAQGFPFVDALERSLHGKKADPLPSIGYPSIQDALFVRALRGIALFALNSFATTLLATALVIGAAFVFAAGAVLLSLPLIEQVQLLLRAAFSLTAPTDGLLVPAGIVIFAVTGYLTYVDTRLSVSRRFIGWIMGLLAIPFVIISTSLFTLMPDLPHRWIFLALLALSYLVVFVALIGVVGLGYIHRSVHRSREMDRE